jgi:glucose-1-phosphate adenylyltransferase
VVLPEDTVIGYDLASDRKKYHVTDSGIVMVEGRRSRVPVSSIEI